MAVDTFLKIDGIKGESQDDKHKDWIEVLSYSQPSGAVAPEAEKKGAGHQPSDILITKQVDASSPILQKFCSSGKHIPKVTLEIMRAQAAKPKTAEMSDVVISKISPVVSAHDKATGGKSVPTESVSFNYGTIKWTYTQQK